MCSEIDARTRENPEAAMLHTRLPAWTDELIARAIEDLGARPLVASNADPVLKTEGEAAAKQVVMVNPDPNAKGQQGFDSEAHRAFMRGLG